MKFRYIGTFANVEYIEVYRYLYIEVISYKYTISAFPKKHDFLKSTEFFISEKFFFFVLHTS